MTVGIITDTVLDNEVLDELDKYRVVVYLNTTKKATSLYRRCRTKRKGEVVLKIDKLHGSINLEWFIENFALKVGKALALNEKEPIHVWIHNKCIVY